MVATFVVKPEAFMQPILSLIAKIATPREGNSNFIIMPSRLGFRPMVLYFEACLRRYRASVEREIPSNFAVRIRMAACSQVVSAPPSTVGASP